MTMYRISLAGIAAMTLAGAAIGQQPPDPNPSSDAFGNSAYGQNALLDLKNPNGGAIIHGDNPGDDLSPDSTEGYVAAFNTAVGTNALQATTVGSYNSGFGYLALFQNTLGVQNTAVGAGSLYANSTGNYNTAVGQNALEMNTTASDNTAVGFSALATNSTGYANTASGYEALYSNTTGAQNTALGYQAIYSSTTAEFNTAVGYQSLYSDKKGANNAALGYHALYYTTGANNVGVGYRAGVDVTTGSNNIDIGNAGAAESDIIRIGTAGTQTAAYIAGIENSKVTGAAVYVTASGQLGVLASSERYKTAIAPVGAASEKLRELRPVSFHLKTDPTGPVQYGLIAEEVEKVYPELVIRDAVGQVQGVRYDELAPLLLNEARQLHEQLAAQDRRAEERDRRAERQEAEIGQLKQQLAEIHAALGELRRADQLAVNQ